MNINIDEDKLKEYYSKLKETNKLRHDTDVRRLKEHYALYDNIASTEGTLDMGFVGFIPRYQHIEFSLDRFLEWLGGGDEVLDKLKP